MQLNNPGNFATRFLDEFSSRGIDSLTAREAQVLVLKLLIDDGIYNFPNDIFKACRDLKLTETKMRNLYQDVLIKHRQYDERQAISNFIAILENDEFGIRKDKIEFVVRDPLLRQYFEDWVARLGGCIDYSFNKNLLVVSKKTLQEVVGVFVAAGGHKLDEKLSAGMTEKIATLNPTSQPKTWREYAALFADAFFAKSGEVAGEMAVKGAGAMFAMLLKQTVGF